MIDREQIRERFTAIAPRLDERARRLLAATEARAAGYGGIAVVSQATGVAPSTIARGLQDLAAESPLAPGQVRRPGGGRKPLAADDPTLRADLLTLVEPDARADPMSPLRWTCKSLYRLADELAKLGHQVSRTVVGDLLKAEKFSLQGNRKTREGSEHPDRDAQFGHINTSVTTALAEQQPVISVDTKKKELVGDPRDKPEGMLQERGPHLASAGRTGRGTGLRLSQPSAGPSDPVWRVRPGHERRLGQRRHEQRYRRLCGADDPPLVARHRPPALSGCAPSGHHRRWRWQQRCAGATVETRATASGQRTGHLYRGPSPAARHQQVEQDRASPVFLHQPELARHAAGQLPRHRRSDQRHHQDRAERSLRTRSNDLSEGHRGFRRRDGGPQHRPRQLPR